MHQRSALLFAAVLVCMAAGNDGQSHPRVIEERRDMPADQTDPSKRAEPFFKTDDGCTMIRMQDFQGQTLKFINNQDFKLDNQFGWVNEYGGTIPAKSMRIFKTADSVWYISEMKPPSVDKKKAVAYNVGEIDAHGYVEDNSRWPGKLNSYPPNEGWAGSMDATPQTKASFQCVCFFKHPEECSEKNVPRSVSVEVASMAAIGCWGAFILAVVGIYQTVRKRYANESLQRSRSMKFLDGYRIILEGKDKPSKEMLTGMDSSTRTFMQQQHVVRESVRYMEECASGTFTLKDKEKTPGVADIFVLKWEKSATVHGGKNVAGGWCDESRNTVGSTEANVCCVCLDSETNVILKPCSHVEFCAMCIIGQACRWSSKLGPGCPICRAPFDSIILSDGTLVREEEPVAAPDHLAVAATLQPPAPMLAWPQDEVISASVSGSIVYAMSHSQDQPSVRGSSSASMQIPNLYEIAVPPQSSSARCYSIAPACTTAVTAAEAINEQREGGVCEGRPRYPGLMNDVDLEAGTTVV